MFSSSKLVDWLALLRSQWQDDGLAVGSLMCSATNLMIIPAENTSLVVVALPAKTARFSGIAPLQNHVTSVIIAQLPFGS